MGIIYVANYMYLAINTGSSTSISITYILFLTKLQKKANPEKGFAQIEKRYHNQLKRCQNERYITRYQRFGIDDFLLKSEPHENGLN